jgi:tetratricopeptide (TPR) repeat protein
MAATTAKAQNAADYVPSASSGDASSTKVNVSPLSSSDEAAAKQKLDGLIQKTSKSGWDRLNNLGMVAYDHFKYAEAQTNFLQAIRELKKGNQKDQRLVTTRNNLGSAYLAEGDYLNSQDAFELALQTERDLSQLNRPEVGRTLEGLAVVYKQTGKSDKAEALLKEVIKTREETLGASSSAVA